jgi:eukaryotic-like serine/threonine-protein kinase
VVSSQTCTECGALIRDGAALGLCSQCALRSALSLEGTQEGFDFTKEIPRTIHSDYELLEEIGRGGMGVVFRARQKSLNRIVALKVFSGGIFSDPAGCKRLLEEAAVAARLRHPNMVTIHEAGELEGHAFYSMDYIAGRTLADVCGSGPVSPTRAAGWLRKIASAIQYAHSQNVLHRDLKPSNVLLDHADEPRITDFGLAKVLDSANTATLTGSIFGSPAYMPPEQAAGRVREIGPAADIYSLGALLYELLTGRPPFQGPSPQAVIEAVKTAEPIAPRRLNPGIPLDLETVTMKCLEKDPAQRYASAQELADDLGRFLEGNPIQARPVGALEKVWRWSRRHPLAALLAGVSLVLGLTTVLVVGVSSQRVRASRDQAQTRLAESLLSESHALRLAGEPGWRARSLNNLVRARGLDGAALLASSLRNEAIAALSRPDLVRHAMTNLPSLNNVMNLCFDAAFARIVFWNPQTAAVEIRRVTDASLLATCQVQEPDEIHSFSPDGRFILLRHGGRMSVWNAATGTVVIAGDDSESHRKFNGGEFSPDGKKFGRGETNGQFVIYDLATTTFARAAKWRLPGGLVCGTVAWSADAKSVALVLGDNTLAICDADSGRVRWQRSYTEMIWNVTWDNTRDWLVLQSGDDRVLILRSEDGSEIDHLNLTANGTPIARLSPDGNFIAASGERFGTQIFDATTRRKLAADPAPAWHLQFDATGTRLGSQLDQGRPLWLEWQPPLVQRTWRSPAQLDLNESLAFSSDGRRLASLTGEGPVVWDVATGKIFARLKVQGTRAITFDSENSRLLCLTDKALFAIALPEEPGQTISEPRRLLEGKNLRGLTRSVDGRVALGDEAGSLVHLFDHGSWAEIHLPIQPLCVAISPDGHWLASGAYLNDNLYVSDVTRPDQPAVKLSSAGNYGVFSPDGKKLFTFGHDIRVWSVGDWRPLSGLPSEPGDAELVIAAVSRDGRWLAATQHDREVHLIELATGKLAAVLDGPGEGGILALEFSPDGNTLAIARDRGDIQIWPLPVLNAELQKLGLGW